jgi:hypothetical protein
LFQGKYYYDWTANMRKLSAITVICAALAAAVGFFLRNSELATAFEPGSGLALDGVPVTSALIGVSAAVVALALVFASAVSRRLAPPDPALGAAGVSADGREPDDLLSEAGLSPRAARRGAPAPIPMGPLAFAVSAASGAVWLFGAVTTFVSAQASGPARERLNAALFALSALSAFTAAYLAFFAHKGREAPGGRFLSILPPLFFSFWMVLVYVDNAANPVVLQYGYRCLALAGAAMSFYYWSGYQFGKREPGKTMFYTLVSVFFCGVSAADFPGARERLVLIAAILAQLANLRALIRGFAPKS